MSLNFNKDMFSALGSSDSFQSSTTAISENAITIANQLAIRLSNYLPPVPLVEGIVLYLPEKAKVLKGQMAVIGYSEGVLNLQLHLESRIDGFLEVMQVAAAMKEIDSYIQQIPSSCANINTIAGTLAGAADVSLDSTINIMLDFEGGLDALDFAIQADNNDDINIALVNLGVKIDTLTNDLNAQINYLENIVSAEVDALRSMYKTHKKMANTFALQRLLEDECVKGIITQLVGDTLRVVIEDTLEGALGEALGDELIGSMN